ncbi:MAG: DUF1990 family protein [Saprospiraceae bacterium]
MLLFLNDQFNRLFSYLPRFKILPVIPYDNSQLKEKNTFVSIPCQKQLKELSFNFIFDYNIFPDNILTYRAEWQHSKRTMQVNDTIVQQIFFPPHKILSQKIIVAVRIKEIFKQDDLIGFSYETLKGHMEKGISFFQISRTNNTLYFTVHTYSRASNLILEFLAPLFSSPYQDYCTKQALKNMLREFKKENNH